MTFLFSVLPYVALAIAVAGGVYRYYGDRFTYSSLSSQLLENYTLFWGSVLWHYGIVLVLLAHLFAGLFPWLSGRLLSHPPLRFLLELAGLCLAFLAVFGISLLIVRRLSDPRVRRVTSVMDWVLLALLFFQVAGGIFIALSYRWGSLWYLYTAVPWFWSLVCFDPKFASLLPLPFFVKLHMINGFVIIGIFPFTRLVHIFTVPITYLWRPYQVVIWNRRGNRLP